MNRSFVFTLLAAILVLTVSVNAFATQGVPILNSTNNFNTSNYNATLYNVTTNGSEVNITTGPINSTCSQYWGFACDQGPPESSSNSLQACSTGAGNFEDVKEIYIEANDTVPGSFVNITCDFNVFGGGGDVVYIDYYNGTDWRNLYNASTSTSGNITVNTTLDNVTGQHIVRCALAYNPGPSGFCHDLSSYYDNDDFPINVVQGNTTINAAVRNIINWYKNGATFQYLNFPFEYGSNATYTMDYSNFNLTGNVTGATWNQSSGPYQNGAYYFAPLSGNKIEVLNDSNLNFTKNFSIMLWEYSISPSFPQPLIIRQSPNSNLTDGYGLYWYNTTAIAFYINNLGNVVVGDAGLGWNHVAATYDGRTMKLYINGALKGVTPFSGNVIGSSGPATMGTLFYLFEYYLNGYLSDVQMFGDVLTPEQIKNYYNNSPNLLAYTLMNTSDTWQGCITTNDLNGNGYSNCSNTLNIISGLAPTQSTPILNSTNNGNFTSHSITVYNQSTFDNESDNVNNIITWFRNGTSIMTLYLPFEGGTNSTYTKDYSNFNNTVRPLNLSYSRNGHNSAGAYEISTDTTNGPAYTLNVTDVNASLLFPSEFTFSFWANPGPIPARPTFGFNGSGFFNSQNPLTSYNFGVSFGDGFGSQLLSPFPEGAANTWTFYTIRSNATSFSVWVNGVVQQSATKTLNVSASTLRNFVFGNSGFDSGMAFLSPYLGRVDDIRAYSVALSDQQISDVYFGLDNVIESNMLSAGDTWQACIATNDGIQDGDINCSNSIVTNSFGNITLDNPSNGSYYNGEIWRSYVNLSVGYITNAGLILNYLNGSVYATTLNSSTMTNDALNDIFLKINVTDNFTWTVCYFNSFGEFACADRFNVQSDLTPPNITVIVPANNSNITTQDINASINATDAETGVDYCIWQVLPAGIPVVVNCSGFIIPNANLAPGVNQINFTAVDNLSNANSTIVIVNVVGINFTIVTPANNSYINISTPVFVPLNLSINDNSTPASCTYTINAGIPVVFDCSNITVNKGSYNEGNNTLNVTMVAINGAISEQIHTVIKDTSRPQLQILNPINGSNLTSLSFNLTTNVTDNVTSINSCWYSLNGAANVSYNCSLAYLLGANGANSIYIFANDSAGNENFTFISFAISVNTSGDFVSCNYRYSTIGANLTLTNENKELKYELVEVGINPAERYVALLVLVVFGLYLIIQTVKAYYNFGKPKMPTIA